LRSYGFESFDIVGQTSMLLHPPRIPPRPILPPSPAPRPTTLTTTPATHPTRTRLLPQVGVTQGSTSNRTARTLRRLVRAPLKQLQQLTLRECQNTPPAARARPAVLQQHTRLADNIKTLKTIRPQIDYLVLFFLLQETPVPSPSFNTNQCMTSIVCQPYLPSAFLFSPNLFSRFKLSTSLP